MDERLLGGNRGAALPSRSGLSVGVLAVLVFDVGELGELLVNHDVGVVAVVADVGRLRAEEEHADELDDEEDLQEVEEPEIAEALKYLAADDGGQG